MRSAARCTYTEVARVLAGERVPERDRFRPTFELMGELQEKLTAMRRRRGALDFDLPEAKILVGQEGEVVAIEKRPRNRAHRIVEEFMLAANEAVARWFGPRDLNALLERFKGHAQQRALNQLLLRAMMQALYTTENIGHYGLAAEHYLHFTSPIRRYPDLVVHRLLKEEWVRRQGDETRRTALPGLQEMAILSSERERASMEAEREIAAFYAALFMKDKVGERFEGVVSAVVEFGMFVELERWFVEGLVRAEDLGEAFQLDPVLHALVEAGSGRVARREEAPGTFKRARPGRKATPGAAAPQRRRPAHGKPAKKGGRG